MFKGYGMAMAVMAVFERMRFVNTVSMPNHIFGFRGKTKRRTTGVRYPHSSTRQRARYARQLAAGQLNIGSYVGPVSAAEAPKKKRAVLTKTRAAAITSRAKVKADV